MIGEDATFNIVGEESIKIALKIGIINKNGIKEIQGVPFALVLLWFNEYKKREILFC